LSAFDALSGTRSWVEIPFHQVKDGQRYSNLNYRPRCFFVQRRPKMGKDRGGSFKLLR